MSLHHVVLYLWCVCVCVRACVCGGGGGRTGGGERPAAACTTRAAAAAVAESSEGSKKRRRNKNVLDDEQFPCTCGGVEAFNAAKSARQEAGGSGRGGKPSCLKNADTCTRGTELKRLKGGESEGTKDRLIHICSHCTCTYTVCLFVVVCNSSYSCCTVLSPLFPFPSFPSPFPPLFLLFSSPPPLLSPPPCLKVTTVWPRAPARGAAITQQCYVCRLLSATRRSYRR
jgi:hypothetical protein